MPPKGFTITITPAFNPAIIIQETLGRLWEGFKLEAGMVLPNLILTHMRQTINRGRRRSGGTGNLANAMNIGGRVATQNVIQWGIGHIPTLMSRAPYYYVVNYGKTKSGQSYIPNWGGFVPGRFRGGDGRPKASMAGKGTERFDYGAGSNMGINPRHAIRPSNYIQKTTFRLDSEIRKLLTKLRTM